MTFRPSSIVPKGVRSLWRRLKSSDGSSDEDFFPVGAPLDTGAERNARTIIGDGQQASVLMAPVLWAARKIATVPLRLYRGQELVDGDDFTDPILGLLPDRTKFSAAVDLILYGNVYLQIVRGPMGMPMRLRYLAPTWVLPRPVGAEEFAYVQVQRPAAITNGGQRAELEFVHRDDLLHIALGVDPNQPSTGLSPLQMLLIEAATDVDAGRLAATVMKNAGHMGVVASAKAAGPDAQRLVVDEKLAASVQAKIDTAYTGSGRGKSFVTGMPLDMHTIEHDMEKLAVQALRDLTAERVCAVMGLPLSVVGLAAGTRQVRIGATMREQRGLAWDNCVLPNLNLLLSQFTMFVGQEFDPMLRIGYELGAEHVANLDARILTEIAKTRYEAGIATRGESRELIGLPATAADNVYHPRAAPGSRQPDTGSQPPEDRLRPSEA